MSILFLAAALATGAGPSVTADLILVNGKIWTVDSLKEAGEKEALDRYQELKRKVAASQKRAEAMCRPDPAARLFIRR